MSQGDSNISIKLKRFSLNLSYLNIKQIMNL